MISESVAAHNSSQALLVWDADVEPWQWDGYVVLWNGFVPANSNNTFSIHCIVEENAGELRANYLAWVYDFGETLVDGKRVIDYLELRRGFSYWWMTLPSMVSFGGSTPVYNAVRLMALEHLARRLRCKSITFVSDNKVLMEAISKWCSNAGLLFQFHKAGARAKQVSIARKIFRTLPYPLQGLISLFLHVNRCWPLRRNVKYFNKGYPNGITFVDALIHLNAKDILKGRFGSNYWTDLVSILQNHGVKTNWIHHYVPHSLIQSARQATDIIDKFNKRGVGFQSHITLDSALCLTVLRDVVRDFMRILLVGVKLCTKRLKFIPKKSDVDFEPIFREEWRKLMFGSDAVINCLFLNQFEVLLKDMPRQRIGIYIQENQPWEMAFIHAWKSAGHGQLVGVPHTTVLFWDTRYYFDPRSYERNDSNDLPLPYRVALNGPVAINGYRDGGYPENQIVEVEALRYLYLNNYSGRFEKNINIKEDLHVLVLGDCLPDITRHQMELLVAAADYLPSNTRYTVKPHPACEIKNSDYPSLHIQVTDAPLAELLVECDVAYTHNSTSAAVDAYALAVPVVSVLDGRDFNMTPLRGLAGVVYVSNPIELAEALHKSRIHEHVAIKPFFCLDSELPRWRKLLSINTDII